MFTIFLLYIYKYYTIYSLDIHSPLYTLYSSRCFKIFPNALNISPTANTSKLIEKYFLDSRNLFSDQENIGIIFSKQEK